MEKSLIILKIIVIFLEKYGIIFYRLIFKDILRLFASIRVSAKVFFYMYVIQCLICSISFTRPIIPR